MTSPIRFYNPREASAEVLEAMLVGREAIVQEILDDLSRQAGSDSRQHWLIRGPRGIGKTHLVAILYHRLRADPTLAQTYLPVWLPEAEAYSVYSAGVLLLQVAEQLVAELRDLGDPNAADLASKIEQTESGGDDPALLEEMAELLRQEARRRDKILVVLMENLDALLAGFSARRSAQEAQRLRSILSEDKEFLFLSTTPTRYLTDLSDPRKPLYGQLKERSLQPLREEEVGQLLEGLARLTGRAVAEPGSGEAAQASLRRRVLHRLTGGNPRAVVMAFSVLSGTPGVRGMVEEMSALLDAQTAYFEARLAQLAPRERAIVTAMALARENLTIQEIAQLTRLPSRSLSTQVERLVEQGYVAPTAGEGGKGTIYELSDGLFRLWYQYRKGKKVLAPIVRLLSLWHPVEVLERTLGELRVPPTEPGSLLERDLLHATALQIEEALLFARSEEGQQERQRLWSECAEEMAKADPEHGNLTDLTVINEIINKSSPKEIDDLIEALLGFYKKIPKSDPSSRTQDFHKLLSFLQVLSWSQLLKKADINEALPEISEWMRSIAFDPAGQIDILSIALTELAVFCPRDSVRQWLEILDTSPAREVVETSNLYRLLLNFLEGAGPIAGKRRQNSRARIRRGLARVPPELRQSVQEMFEGVRAVDPLSAKLVQKRRPAE